MISMKTIILALASGLALSTPVSTANQAPVADPACKDYNARDCRKYELYPVPSADIDKYMIIGNESNVPKEVEELQGLFYMNGNPLSDECFSLANSYYDPAKDAVIVNVYDAGIWSWSPNLSGAILYNTIRKVGLTYQVRKTPSGYEATPENFFAPGLALSSIETSKKIARFTVERTDDPNIWNRRSYFFEGAPVDYSLQRIVYANGTRTPLFESTYLPNINSGKDSITLKDTQLLSRVKN